MAEKQIPGWQKQALELGPTLAFFVIYMRIKDDSFTLFGTEMSGFIVSALVFIPILLAAMAVLWALTGKLSRMQIFTAVMVIFFGGLTAWFNDERFFKMKTSIVYATMAGLLGIGLLRGESWLQALLGEMIPMERAGWMKLTWRVMAMLALFAGLNELVWRTQSDEVWVTVETFVFPILMALGLMGMFISLNAYMIEDDDEERG
ncbi:MAG: intracellular septation protein A [Rhodobacterales bacterium]|nr:MAG: intracellular septation protein A [Rhodobacterales bacterium]